jgi:hypothetical protein
MEPYYGKYLEWAFLILLLVKIAILKAFSMGRTLHGNAIKLNKRIELMSHFRGNLGAMGCCPLRQLNHFDIWIGSF